MERLLQKVNEAAAMTNSSYWLTAGSSIGTLLHHGRIRWDDDVDIYYIKEEEDKLFAYLRNTLNLTVLKRYKQRVWKLFEPTSRVINVKKKQQRRATLGYVVVVV